MNIGEPKREIIVEPEPIHKQEPATPSVPDKTHAPRPGPASVPEKVPVHVPA